MTIERRTMPVLALCFVWFSLVGGAQQAAPSFEVASVRPNTSTDGTFNVPPTPPEGVVLHNRSVGDVVRYAYQLPSFRVFGLPGWAEEERFDIVAKAARPITEDERQAMVRALLADRFRVKAHFEKRDQTVYVMTRAKGDGSLGPGAMSLILGQVVHDRSGIEGVFDVQASWRPDAVDAAVDPSDQRPSFFTAIQEQLGLRLDPRREAVEVLVIDSVQRPTPD